MFRQAIIKTTGIYLGIIMLISLFFSLNIYFLSTNELSRGLRKQQHFYESSEMMSPAFRSNILDERNNFLEEAKRNIIIRLIFTNVAILIFGGGLSYFLARKTIEPIETAHQNQIRFTADASHELRSPLAALKTEIEVGLRDKKATKDDYKKIIESNLEEVDRLKLLTENLLELARDKSDSDKSEINLKETIDRAILGVGKRAKNKRIIIRSDIFNFTTLGDEKKIQRLFEIILDNAIKYSETDKKIEIKFKKNNHGLIIDIADRGRGIKESDISKIFERFYQGDAARNNRDGVGYGLGLSIAQKIAVENNIKIEVSSQENIGTTFSLTFFKS